MPKPTEIRRCERCQYWHYTEFDSECRRHAPVPMTVHSTEKWPRTKARDWCGEFLLDIIACDSCTYFNHAAPGPSCTTPEFHFGPVQWGASRVQQ